MTKLAFALFLAACALPLTACGPMPVALRADVTTIPISRRLEGTQVAVSKVRDLRADRSVLGQHRDGFARVTQYDYAAGTDLRGFLRKLTELSLLANGATLVAPAEATLRVEIDVLALDVTTDGALAGEETFGMVQLSFRFLGRNEELIGERVIKRSFTNEELSDRGLLGDALRDAVLVAMRHVQPRTEMREYAVEVADAIRR